MRSWRQLYKNELRNCSFFLLVVGLIVLGWHLFLGSKFGSSRADIGFGLSFIPLGFFPLVMMRLGFQSFRREWKQKTIYYILSLPRAGCELAVTKFLAGLTGYILLSGLSIFMTGFFYGDVIRSKFIEGVPFSLFLTFIIFYLIMGGVIYILAQTSYLISRFFHRFRGVISILVFVLSHYLIFRLGGILGPLFKWVPNIPITVQGRINDLVTTKVIYIGTGPLVGSLIAAVVIFLLGSWVLETQLEA